MALVKRVRCRGPREVRQHFVGLNGVRPKKRRPV